jgi:hypothetical protein
MELSGTVRKMQSVVALPLSEIITMSHHLRSPEIHAYMNLEPLKDLRNPETPPPTPVDDSGRSAQIFVVDAIGATGRPATPSESRMDATFTRSRPDRRGSGDSAGDGQEERIRGLCAWRKDSKCARDFLGSLCPGHMQVEIS